MVAAIVRRELIGGGRSARLFVARVVFLVAVTLAAVALLRDGVHQLNASHGHRPVDPKDFVVPLGLLQMALVALLAPGLSIGAISRDRASGALDILRATGVGAGRFVAGKFLSRMAIVLLLAASAVPLLLLSTLVGGAGGSLVATIALETVAVGAVGCAIGLSASAMGGTATASIALAYGAVVAWAVLPWTVIVTLFYAGSPSMAVHPAVAWSPFLTVVWIAEGRGASLAGELSTSMACQSAIALLAILPALISVRRRTHERVSPAVRAALAVLDASSSRARGSRAVIGNPIVWRDARASRKSLALRLIRIAYLAIGGGVTVLGVIFAMLVRDTGWDSETLRVPILLLVYGAAVLAIVTAAASLTTEKEAGTLPLLALVGLRGREIAMAKLAGVGHFLWPVAVVVVLPTILWLGLDDGALWKVPLIAAAVLTWAGGIGLWASARFRRTHVAVPAAMVVAALWAFGAPMLLELMHVGTERTDALIDPPVAAMFAISYCGTGSSWLRSDVSWSNALAGLAIGGAVGVLAILLAAARLDDAEALA